MSVASQAEQFRALLAETLEGGTVAATDRAWKRAWEANNDPLFKLMTPEPTQRSLVAESEAFRSRLLEVLLAEPGSDARNRAWTETEVVQLRINRILTSHRERVDEVQEGPPVEASSVSESSRTTNVVDQEPLTRSEQVPSPHGESELSDVERTIVGELLKDLKQSVHFCDHINLSQSTPESGPTGKERLMVITDYRISFCRSVVKIGRGPVASTVYLIDIARIDIDDRFSITSFTLKSKRPFYVWCRSPKQLKSMMEALSKALDLILIGYPAEERPKLFEPYGLTSHAQVSKNGAILRTYAAICDRAGISVPEFPPYLVSCTELDRKALNLKKAIGNQRSAAEAVDIVCQALRYNCSQFIELFGASVPFADAGIAAIIKLFSGNSCFTSIDISFSACTFRGMEMLSRTIKSIPMPWLRSLNVSGNPMGDDGIALLLSGLSAADIKLEELSCAKCSLTSRGFDDLALYLESAGSLHVVNFSSNMPSKSGFVSLHKGFSHSPLIERIYIADCGANASAVLSFIIQHSPRRLNLLDLSKTRLASEDLLQLAHVIKDTTTLSHISLSACKICLGNDALTLFHAIAKNTSKHLRFVIDVSDNYDKVGSVWPFALRALSDGAAARNLFALNLNNCKLSPDDLVLACRGLQSLNGLKVLSLNGNIKSKAFQREACILAGTAISKLLNANQSIAVLSICGSGSSHHFGSHSINQVLDGLFTNKTLSCLFISANHLTNATYDLLKRLIETSSTLHYVDVDHNRASLSSLWALSSGIVLSTSLCSSLPRADFIDQIVGRKSRNLVGILSTAVVRQLEQNTARNASSFRLLHDTMRSVNWLPLPIPFLHRIATRAENVDLLGRVADTTSLPTSYSSPVVLPQYECAIPFVLTYLGDRIRSPSGIATKGLFKMQVNSARFRRVLQMFVDGHLDQINDVVCYGQLIVEYIRQLKLLSALSCEEMRSAMNPGLVMSLLRTRLHSQARAILFWLCDLLNYIAKGSRETTMNDLVVQFTLSLYPVQLWLDNDFDRAAYVLPTFVEQCIKLRSK